MDEAGIVDERVLQAEDLQVRQAGEVLDPRVGDVGTPHFQIPQVLELAEVGHPGVGQQVALAKVENFQVGLAFEVLQAAVRDVRLGGADALDVRHFAQVLQGDVRDAGSFEVDIFQRGDASRPWMPRDPPRPVCQDRDARIADGRSFEVEHAEAFQRDQVLQAPRRKYRAGPA